MSSADVCAVVACPICAGTRSVAVRELGRHTVYACPSCGVQFEWPQPSDQDLDRIYDRGYYDSWDLADGEDATRGIKRLTFARYLDALPGRVSPGRCLDVGCATGFFLEVAQARGWDVWGADYSPYAVEVALKKFDQYRIHCGGFESAGHPAAFFDLVTMFDVLEHLRDPRRALAEAARITRREGLLLLTTPNVSGLMRRLMGRFWPHYKVEHLYYFGPGALRSLLEDAGYRLLLMKPNTKVLSFRYLSSQFRAYPLPVVAPLAAALGRLPGLRTVPLLVPTGETLCVACRL